MPDAPAATLAARSSSATTLNEDLPEQRSISPATFALRVGALTALVAAGVAAIVTRYIVTGHRYMTDDAFISFRYAVNLAEGHGPVWSAGDRVEGYTNFGWVLLIALAQKWGADPIDSSRALGVLAAAGTLALMPLLAAQLRPAWSGRWWLLSATAIAALAINSGFSLWTFAGLETPAAAFFVTSAVTLHLFEERTLRLPVWSPIAFVAAALVRPDAIVIWAVCGLFKCARLLAADRRAQVAGIALWAAMFLAPFGAYWLWRWSYYGDFFPNTYYLKTGRSRELAERGLRYAWEFITIYWIWLGLAALVSAWRERATRHLPAACLLAIVAVWLAYVIDAGGDWMPFYRFFIPVLPLAYMLIAHGLIDLGDALPIKPRATWLAPAAGLALAAVVVFSSARPYDSERAKNPARFEESPYLAGAVDTRVHATIGRWMRENLPADYTVAQIATGIVPYYSRLPTIDMLGVNDRHIARLDIPLGRGVAGHEKEDGGYVISREPEIIWLDLSLEKQPRDSIEDYMPPAYKQRVPVITNITNNAYVWFLYRPVAVRLPDGWLNLLVHRSVDIPALRGDAAAGVEVSRK